MRSAGIAILLFLLFSSCGKKNKPPQHILGQEKMEAVLWDVMRADQFIYTYVLPKDSSKKKEEESRKLYSQIFQLHTISEQQFRQSYTWYKEHPAVLKVIMDSVSKRNEAPESTPMPVILEPVTDSISKIDSGKPQSPPPVSIEDSLRRKRIKKVIPID
jgi:hypothetical protein